MGVKTDPKAKENSDRLNNKIKLPFAIFFVIAIFVAISVVARFYQDKFNDLYTPALYLFSTIAQTMGALLGIGLALLYTIISNLKPTEFSPAYEPAKRLLLKDSILNTGINVGFVSILLSITGLFIITFFQQSSIVLFVIIAGLGVFSFALGIISIIKSTYFLKCRYKLYFIPVDLVNDYAKSAYIKDELLIDYLELIVLLVSADIDVGLTAKEFFISNLYNIKDNLSKIVQNVKNDISKYVQVDNDILLNTINFIIEAYIQLNYVFAERSFLQSIKDLDALLNIVDFYLDFEKNYKKRQTILRHLMYNITATKLFNVKDYIVNEEDIFFQSSHNSFSIDDAYVYISYRYLNRWYSNVLDTELIKNDFTLVHLLGHGENHRTTFFNNMSIYLESADPCEKLVYKYLRVYLISLMMEIYNILYNRELINKDNYNIDLPFPFIVTDICKKYSNIIINITESDEKLKYYQRYTESLLYLLFLSGVPLPDSMKDDFKKMIDINKGYLIYLILVSKKVFKGYKNTEGLKKTFLKRLIHYLKENNFADNIYNEICDRSQKNLIERNVAEDSYDEFMRLIKDIYFEI